MSKKLFFNSGASIVDVPFETGAVADAIFIPHSWGNGYFIPNQYLNGRITLQYLTGEDAGYFSYTANVNFNITIELKKKDGTVFHRQTSGPLGYDSIYNFEDLFKVTEINNFRNLVLRINN